MQNKELKSLRYVLIEDEDGHKYTYPTNKVKEAEEYFKKSL